MIVKFEKEGLTPFTLDTDKLPAASVEYLLQYGFAQSMQDCIAGRAKAVATEREKEGDTKAEIAEAIAIDIESRLAKRRDAIESGTMTQPSTRDPVAALAKEDVLKALREKGKKASPEKLAELVANHVEKNRAALVAEVERRKVALPVAEVEIDI